MSDAWPTARLADLAAPVKGAIAGGPFGSDLVSADYVEEGVPVIRGVNLPFDRKIELDNLVFVSEAKADSLHLNCAAPGDLVFTQRGTLGQVGLLPEHPRYSRYLISQSQMKMTVDPGKANARYLYYYFRLPSSVAYIENHALQSGVPHINLGILRKLGVILPPLPVQHRIAAVLEAYDDLIANNQRRIALLESMAEEIYREWFVRMRFPGAKSAVFDKGVPTGWTHEPILGAFKFYGGATPAKDNPRFWVDGDVHWYTPTDVTGASSPYLEESADKCTDEGLQNCSANLFPAYSIMMTSRATIGAIGINCAPACTNQGFITCIPNQRYPLTYLYHWLKLAKPHFEMLAGGATFAELTKGTFKRIRILTPPLKLVAAYEKQVRPMFDQVEALTKMNRRLRAIRDSLLPRLISGKLRVDALDIQFPPSMQPPPAEAAPREPIDS